MFRCSLCGDGTPNHGTACPGSSNYVRPNPPTLAERVESRIRAEWPGTWIEGRQTWIPAHPIREDGATDTFVKLAARIIREEVSK